MRQQASDYLSAHGQTTSRSQIPHRQALRCHCMMLADSVLTSSNATSSHASPRPEPSVTSRTSRKRRADDTLRNEDIRGFAKNSSLPDL